MNIWFTSDLHFGHKNIVLSESSWTDKTKCRDFTSVKEHDEILIDEINCNVKANDTLYFMGDWSFGGKENVIKYRQRLYVKNIHLCLGNHDHHIAKFKSPEYNAFTSVQYVIDRHTEHKLRDGIPLFMSHYKHMAWPKQHKGVIHLYGHSHGSLEHLQVDKSMDVGVDNAKLILNAYRPFHLDEITYLLDNRTIKLI